MPERTISITVNGQPRTVPEGTTLQRLIADSGAGTDRVAAEVNKQVVRRADHPSTILNDGDRIEIVTFVGGG